MRRLWFLASILLLIGACSRDPDGSRLVYLRVRHVEVSNKAVIAGLKDKGSLRVEVFRNDFLILVPISAIDQQTTTLMTDDPGGPLERQKYHPRREQDAQALVKLGPRDIIRIVVKSRDREGRESELLSESLPIRVDGKPIECGVGECKVVVETIE